MADDDKPHHGRRIGELNGKWAFLLKITVVCVPLSLPWFVWSTSEAFANQSFRNSGERFTQLDGAMLRADIMSVIAGLPPPEWRDRIKQVEANQNEMMRSIARIEAQLNRQAGAEP